MYYKIFKTNITSNLNRVSIDVKKKAIERHVQVTVLHLPKQHTHMKFV